MNVNPTVYSLVFGENVLNDDVSIVLFRSIYSNSRINMYLEKLLTFEQNF